MLQNVNGTGFLSLFYYFVRTRKELD